MGVRYTYLGGVLVLVCSCGSSAGGPSGGRLDQTSVAPDGAPATMSRLRYDTDRTHSPISSAIAANLRVIASGGNKRNDNMFMKVGDSITESYAAMSCFVDNNIDLAGRTELQSTIDYYASANLSGPSKCAEDWCRAAHTSYNRDSYAAQGGATSAFPLDGSPRPLETEDSAIAPRIAMVQFGTNDSTVILTAADIGGFNQFYQRMVTLVDTLEARGVIPVLYTIPPYIETRNGHANVPTMNAIIRAIAQSRAIPLIDFGRELLSLPSYGLWDGVHPRVEFGGCVFTSDGLQYGYNVRNLLSIEALSRVHGALTGAPAPDAATTLYGRGTAADPFLVDGLPFVDAVDSGSIVYRLTVGSQIRVRFLALSQGAAANVTVRNGGSQVGSGNGAVQATLAAGKYDVTVSGGGGAIAMVVCDAGDAACN